jgi:hypothetical protein
MKPRNTITAVAILMALAINPAHGGNNGNNGNGGGGGGGGDDGGVGNSNALVSLDSASPYIPKVESESFDNKGQVVFYGYMDLREFPGSYNNGDTCLREEVLTEGIIVIHPDSKSSPEAAELIFWYRDVLDSGEPTQHLLTMAGIFDERDNWPPTADDPSTTVTLEYWKFAAENRKAQRQDCAGSYDYTGEGPWVVTVSLVPLVP